jgi:hypothetical protein
MCVFFLYGKVFVNKPVGFDIDDLDLNYLCMFIFILFYFFFVFKVSREMLQDSPVLQMIARKLARRIIQMMSELRFYLF